MDKKKIKNKVEWTVGGLCRIVLALVFIFSGFVKAVDPMGTVFKFTDYLAAFGMSGMIGEPFVKFFAIVLIACEFTLGIYTLFGIRRRFTSTVLLLFMLGFTPFTLYLALKNPVSDCGCFGDAFVLTNWQTFYKNLVLLACALYLRFRTAESVRVISERNQWIVSIFSLSFICLFSIYTLHYLPLIDFRPYKIGVNIKEAMTIPEGAKAPVYETTFVLKKNGVQREFSIENYPDSTWTFVDSKNILIEDGYVPPITDFSVTSVEGEDFTDQLLSYSGYTFVLISPYVEQADMGVVDAINALYDYCTDSGYRMIGLTASGQAAVKKWKVEYGAEYPIYITDAVCLKTIIRSNPGLLLLKNGTIVGKWSGNDIPDELILKDRLENLPISHVEAKKTSSTLLKILLLYLIPLLIITLADRIWVGSKAYKKYKEKKQNNIINKSKENEKENCSR